jgi:hypothetical protein
MNGLQDIVRYRPAARENAIPLMLKDFDGSEVLLPFRDPIYSEPKVLSRQLFLHGRPGPVPWTELGSRLRNKSLPLFSHVILRIVRKARVVTLYQEAAGFQYAESFVQSRLPLGDQVQQVDSQDDIEGVVGERKYPLLMKGKAIRPVPTPSSRN